MAKTPAPLKQLNAQESAFVEKFVASGSWKAAALEAGYGQDVAIRVPSVLLSRPHIAWAVAIEMRKRFGVEAPASLNTLVWLRDNATSEKIRTDCAKDILNRAGHVAPRVPDLKPETPLHEMSTDQLRELANRLEGELADRSKPVISATSAPSEQSPVDLTG